MIVYTDSACKHDGRSTGVCGIGVIALFEDVEVFSFRETIFDKTNNFAELYAVSRALKSLIKRGITSEIELRTDSQYVCFLLNSNCQRCKYDDLLKEVVELIAKFDKVTVVKVSHKDDQNTRKVDRLAKSAMHRRRK